MTNDEQDLIGALRLRPGQTIEELASYTGSTAFVLESMAVRLAKAGHVTAEATADEQHRGAHRWYAIERGNTLYVSVLPALLNQLGKHP